MSVIKIKNGKKLGWYAGELLPGIVIEPRLILQELTDADFPLQIEKPYKMAEYSGVHKFEIRITKKGGLSMHYMGAKQR